MNYQISDMLLQVRDVVQDADVPYRHSDDKLLRYFNNAMADARRLRGDLFSVTINSTWVIYTTADLGLDFPLDPTYFSAVVDYVSAQLELGDDEFVSDGRSSILHQRFVTKLTGKFA